MDLKPLPAILAVLINAQPVEELLGFMEAERSIQKPVIRTYPEPDESHPNPHRITLFFNIYFNILYVSTSSSPMCCPPYMFPDQIFVSISHFAYDF